jgi:hypothetical protein
VSAPAAPGDVGPADRYRRIAAERALEVARLEATARRVSLLRLTTFLTGTLAILLAESLPGDPRPWWLGGGAVVVAFLVLVARHRRLRARIARAEAAHTLAREGVARVERRWDDLPPPAPASALAGEGHPYARDLDLYGRASLRALMGPLATPMGARTLDGWLLAPAPVEVLRPRQEAVRELARRHELREALAAEGALLDPVPEPVLDRFLGWLDEPGLASGRAMAVARWLLPAMTATMAVLDVAGVLPPAGWVSGLIVQAALAWRMAPRLHASFARGSSGAPGLRRYHTLIQHWEAAELEAPHLRELRAELRPADGGTASEALARLERLLDASDARLSGMLHGVVAVGLLWDLHVAAALEAWRAKEGAHVPAWLDVLGRLEALAALATLAADHPGWAWPDLDVDGPPVLRARALGHPLLPDEACVRNDVEVGPPGTVLLVTGSNMSGKSTLLRSLGCAAVLARSGAPVCADSLALPPVRLFTSMRVEDSLQEGVSLFMAELKRLTALLSAAPPAGASPAGAPPAAEPPAGALPIVEPIAAAPPATADAAETLLYLVDEVLQGTNSEERRIAGRRLVRHLLRRRAIGAVTTHDLDLHRHPEVEAAARMVHFREVVAEAGPDQPALAFDYRLRPGLATTRNALRLAELTGLTDPDV